MDLKGGRGKKKKENKNTVETYFPPHRDPHGSRGVIDFREKSQGVWQKYI